MSKKKKVIKNNYVTKYMEQFNTPKTHRDKTKYYRKRKHKNTGYDMAMM